MQGDKLTALLVEAALCEDEQKKEAIFQEAYKLADERLAKQQEKKEQAQLTDSQKRTSLL